MSKYVIDDSTLASIAEAIRGKTGGADPIAVTDMAAQIASITGGGSADEVILAEQSATVTFRETLYLTYVNAPNPIKAGETYKVIWDGTEYECTAVSLAGTSYESWGEVAMGNTLLLGGSNNNLPFGLVYSEANARLMVISLFATGTTTHTVAIYKEAIGGGSVEGVVYVTFKNWDGTDLLTKPVFIGDHCTDPVDIGQITEPTRESTNTEVFTHNGWSLTAGGAADASALLNVTEDRTVYAAYEVKIRYYTINFFDGEDATAPMHTVYAEYGATVEYTPEKEGELFDSWNPAIVPVVADADYYAVWAEIQTYGVEWDYSKTSPILTRTEASAAFSNPVPGTSSAPAGSSPFDDIMPWAGMKRHNIISNAVSYSEDDEGFSMTDYDTVVYIPPFYYKAEKDEANTKWRWSICPVAKEGYALHPGSGRYIGRYHASGSYSAVYSKSGVQPYTNAQRGMYRTYCHNKGSKWWMLDFATWSAVQILYLIEFANLNIQNRIGRGNGGSSAKTGISDSYVYHTHNAGGTCGQYRWIEFPYGRVFTMVDGFVASGTACYIGTDNSKFADSTSSSSGLTPAGVTLPASDYITGFGYSEKFPWAFLPDSATGGSSTTYVTDKVLSATDSGTYVACVGGSFNQTSNNDISGMFYLNAKLATDTANQIYGTRLIFIP